MKNISLHLVLLLAFCCSAVAGDISRIGGPPRLQGVKHKILVLEFDSPQLSDWGRDISQIIAQQVLGTIEGVTSVGVINLRQTETRIELTPKRIHEEALNQNALVVIWGEFYEDSTDVWLHPHLRLVPREEFPVSAFGLMIPDQYSRDTLKAAIPTLQVNFAPLRLPMQTLKDLSRFYRQTVTLRESPDLNAPSTGQLQMGDTYYLIDKQNDWTKISTRSGKTGWIRHTVLDTKKQFEDLQGVVKLAQGIVQYMAGNYRLSANSFQNYLDKNAYRQDSMNRAFAHIMLGNSKFWGKEYFNRIPRDEDVSIEYYRAKQLLPGHPSPVNHLAIVNMYKMRFHPSREMIPAIEKELIEIIKTQNDLDAIGNLRIAYGMVERNLDWLAKRDGSSESAASLRSRLNEKISKLDHVAEQLKVQRIAPER
ncbi:MAG: SH3 domain-containing protein [Calditrichaeota bacterium]|nr:SH3 domain-containing protein [Calditrichota bacterium]